MIHPDDWITAALLRHCWMYRALYIQYKPIYVHPCPVLADNPSYGVCCKWTSIQPQTRHFWVCVPYQRGGPQHETVHSKAASLFPSLYLPPFFSLTHTHSPFSSPSKKMPKDRSKKMNRSQRLSWQQHTEATSYLDQQENWQSKP